MKLYTKRGDAGKTSIIGASNLSKSNTRITAYGTVDELNSHIGEYYHFIEDKYHEDITYIQTILFEIGSELASVKPRNKLQESDIKKIETLIDNFEELTPPITTFILPKGAQSSCYAHVLRTITRRAEREAVRFNEEVQVDPLVLQFLNRLSDYFFAFARYENHRMGIGDISWEPRK